LHTCANDRIGYAIVRRSPLLSSADSDEATDGANDPAIVRRSPLLSSADSDEANDGANDPAIVRTEALYPLTASTDGGGGLFLGLRYGSRGSFSIWVSQDTTLGAAGKPGTKFRNRN
jgi:hypothetical protein